MKIDTRKNSEQLDAVAVVTDVIKALRLPPDADDATISSALAANLEAAAGQRSTDGAEAELAARNQLSASGLRAIQSIKGATAFGYLEAQRATGIGLKKEKR